MKSTVGIFVLLQLSIATVTAEKLLPTQNVVPTSIGQNVSGTGGNPDLPVVHEIKENIRDDNLPAVQLDDEFFDSLFGDVINAESLVEPSEKFLITSNKDNHVVATKSKTIVKDSKTVITHTAGFSDIQTNAEDISVRAAATNSQSGNASVEIDVKNFRTPKPILSTTSTTLGTTSETLHTTVTSAIPSEAVTPTPQAAFLEKLPIIHEIENPIPEIIATFETSNDQSYDAEFPQGLTSSQNTPYHAPQFAYETPEVSIVNNEQYAKPTYSEIIKIPSSDMPSFQPVQASVNNIHNSVHSRNVFPAPPANHQHPGYVRQSPVYVMRPLPVLVESPVPGYSETDLPGFFRTLSSTGSLLKAGKAITKKGEFLLKKLFKKNKLSGKKFMSGQRYYFLQPVVQQQSYQQVPHVEYYEHPRSVNEAVQPPAVLHTTQQSEPQYLPPPVTPKVSIYEVEDMKAPPVELPTQTSSYATVPVQEKDSSLFSGLSNFVDFSSLDKFGKFKKLDKLPDITHVVSDAYTSISDGIHSFGSTIYDWVDYPRSYIAGYFDAPNESDEITHPEAPIIETKITEAPKLHVDEPLIQAVPQHAPDFQQNYQQPIPPVASSYVMLRAEEPMEDFGKSRLKKKFFWWL